MHASYTPVLLTLTVSHYCEKARWALDHAGIAYREEAHLPLLHRRHTGRLGGRSVPILGTAGGALRDSAAIVAWADAHARTGRLLPVGAADRSDALEFERYLDREVGVHARRWAYGYLLDHPALLVPCFARGAPVLERAVAPLVVRLVLPLIRKGYKVDAANAQASLARVEGAFAAVEERLADGRPYLVGESFGVADLTFASLAAPMLAPEGYGGAFPPYARLPAAMRSTIDRLRATRAGRYGLELYERHRRP